VLIADDQPDVLAALYLLLKAEGYQTQSASSPDDILTALESGCLDLVLMDLNYTRDTTSGQEGLDLLAKLQSFDEVPPIVVMTAWGSIELAVEAMRGGARDFITKPWDNSRLLELLRKNIVQRPASPQPSVQQLEGERAETGDMKLAGKVQAKLLPQKMPPLETLEYAGHCRQAGAVGGDYYDFLDLGQGRMALVLGDVSGKGVPAALLMASLQAMLRSHCSQTPYEPGSLLESVNRLFCEATAPEHYATLFFGEYDDRTRRLRYVNCGHTPPLILRRHGRVERLSSTATVLGLFTDFRCEAREVNLDSGDTLLVFSDGVTETPGKDGEEFGEARLVEQLRAHSHRSVSSLPAALSDALVKCSSFGQQDDLTVVAARGR
jgi:sigma-B regulation protein RsbU (phosphoserine phosphatase)